MSKVPSITYDVICPKRAFEEEFVALVSDWQQRSLLIKSLSWKIQRLTDKMVISLHTYSLGNHTKNNLHT